MRTHIQSSSPWVYLFHLFPHNVDLKCTHCYKHSESQKIRIENALLSYTVFPFSLNAVPTIPNPVNIHDFKTICLSLIPNHLFFRKKNLLLFCLLSDDLSFLNGERSISVLCSIRMLSLTPLCVVIKSPYHDTS